MHDCGQEAELAVRQVDNQRHERAALKAAGQWMAPACRIERFEKRAQDGIVAGLECLQRNASAHFVNHFGEVRDHRLRRPGRRQHADKVCFARFGLKRRQ